MMRYSGPGGTQRRCGAWSEFWQHGQCTREEMTDASEWVVWYSLASSQIPGDTRGTWDVFYADYPVYDDTLFADGFDR